MNGVDIFPQSRAGTARNVNETGFPPEGGDAALLGSAPSRPRSFVTWGCWRVGPTRMVRVVNAEGVLPFVHTHRHGGNCGVPDMKIEQLTVVNICNHITIRHNEWRIWLGIK